MFNRTLTLSLALLAMGTGLAWGKSALLDWKQFRDFDWNYSIDTPFPMVKDRATSTNDSVFYTSPIPKGEYQGMEIRVGATFFPDSKKTLTIDETPKMVLDTLLGEKRVTGLKLFDTALFYKGTRFLVSNGTAMNKAGKPVKFKVLNAVLLPYWWRVIISYDPSQPRQENIADRIVSSFEIQP
jgi:hypothetical protein